MARLVTSGAEFQAATTVLNQAEGQGYICVGPPAIETTIVRSGAAAWKSDANGKYARWTTTTSDADNYYLRGYFYWDDTPAAVQNLIVANPGRQGYAAVLAGTTTVALFGNDDVQVGSASGTLALDTWHRVELVIGRTATLLELYVNGVQIASTNSAVLGASTISDFRFGMDQAGASTDTVYWDDVAINDSTGGVDDGLPGPGKIILRLAASDFQRDATWAEADLGTTALYDEVNNVPITATATTNFIVNGASTTTDTYTAETTTYSAGGIAAADRVKVVQAVALIGDAVGAATRSIGLKLDANPSDTEVTATTPNAGIGNYPTGWITMRGTLDSSPSVTLGSPIQVKVRKNSANADGLAVALLGVYVEYGPPTLVTPAAATETDTAQSLDVDKARGVTVGTETDVAQALVVTKPILKSIAPAAEADAAQSLSHVKPAYKTVTPATEADAAQAVTFSNAIDVSITPATETDTAQALSVSGLEVAPATETDEAQPLTYSQAGAQGIVPADETDTAQVLGVTHVHYVTLVPATETDEAQGLSVGVTAPPDVPQGGWVNVRRRPIRRPQIVSIFPAQEHDRAISLGFVKTPNRIATEDDELLLLA